MGFPAAKLLKIIALFLRNYRSSTYHIEVSIKGSKVTLAVNGIKTLENELPRSIDADQVGLFAWGHEPIEFDGASVSKSE